jgi:hypothetical protein
MMNYHSQTREIRYDLNIELHHQVHSNRNISLKTVITLPHGWPWFDSRQEQVFLFVTDYSLLSSGNRGFFARCVKGDRSPPSSGDVNDAQGRTFHQQVCMKYCVDNIARARNSEVIYTVFYACSITKNKNIYLLIKLPPKSSVYGGILVSEIKKERRN